MLLAGCHEGMARHQLCIQGTHAVKRFSHGSNDLKIIAEPIFDETAPIAKKRGSRLEATTESLRSHDGPIASVIAWIHYLADQTQERTMFNLIIRCSAALDCIFHHGESGLPISTA